MKWKRSAAAAAVSLGLLSIILPGCGGGGSDSGGTLSVDLTDAKPALPEGVTHVDLTVDRVDVHRSGGGWVNLPLDKDPYTVDVLQFTDGITTTLVPPTALEPGTYTQLRLNVKSATLTLAGGSQVMMDVPSGEVRADRNFELIEGGAVALTVDFDLSQSIVAQGGSYQLKPVLHVVPTSEAASIQGDITFPDGVDAAEVTVTADTDGNDRLSDGDKPYTILEVTTGDPSFDLLWLVPDQGYTVQVKVGGVEYSKKFVTADQLALAAGHNVVLTFP